MVKKGFYYIWPVLLIVFFAVAIFYRLDRFSLWQDEAETALLAKSVLVKGYPNALVDGKWITQFHGLESTSSHLWFFTPWLPFYLCALSFKIFGTTDWAARFPFALSGLLCAILLWRLVFSWTQNRQTALLTLFFYVTNVSVLLYTRQAKYYPLYILGYLIALYGLVLWKNGKRGFSLVLCGFLICFHSNYLPAGLAFLGFGLYAFLNREGKPYRPVFLKTAAGLVLFFLPFLFLAPMESRFSIVGNLPSLGLYLKKLGTHLYYWNNQIFPLLLGLVLIWKRPPHFIWIGTTLLATWLGLPLFGIDVLRFGLHLIPLFCFLIGYLLVELFQKDKSAAVLLFLVLFATNFFQNMPDAVAEKSFKKLFQKEEWIALKNYYFKDYKDPLKEIPGQLKPFLNEGERVYINHDQLSWAWYSDIPLGFLGEAEKTPHKDPPLLKEWISRSAVNWWIGPHPISAGQGPHIGEEELEPILKIETDIPTNNWGLNSPIRYKHFLKRFASQPPNGEERADHKIFLLLSSRRKR